MKRRSEEPIAEDVKHIRLYSMPTSLFGRKIQPAQDVIEAATIIYSFRNPHVLRRTCFDERKVVFPPPRMAFKEEHEVPFHGDGLRYQQLKQQIRKKAENNKVFSVIKELTRSDVLDTQGRLLLPRKFVKETVEPLLLNEDEVLVDGINVKVYNDRLQKFDMVFKGWVNKKVFVLSSDWNKFYRENGLEEKMNVDICAFRHDVSKKICFAVLRTPEHFGGLLKQRRGSRLGF